METKPFYLTSEFYLTLGGLIVAAVTAYTNNASDPQALGAAVAAIVAYVLSRGRAKQGVAFDPDRHVAYRRRRP